MNTEIDRKIAVIFVADVVGYSKHLEKGIWGKQKNILRGQKNKNLIWLDLKKGWETMMKNFIKKQLMAWKKLVIWSNHQNRQVTFCLYILDY